MSMILKSILNAYYCKEISKKIRATYDMNMRNHQSIRIAPFGYTVNEDHTGFVIDPEPAETVREIYRLSLSGLNFSDITRVLNNNHVLTPTSYNMMKNWKRTGVCGRIDTTYWSAGTVNNILRDPVYTGRLTLHKVTVAVPSSRKIRKIDPSEQYVFEDAHEPIISKEDFAKVQELHPPRKSPGKRKRNVAPHILRGYVFCGVCKKGLIPTNTRNASYYCPTASTADADCRQDAIPESELDQAVLSALLPLLRIFCSLPDKSNQTQTQKWLSECQKDILQNQVKQDGLQRMKLDLYEQYTSGDLPLLSYQQQKQSLNHEIQELKRAEAKLREQEATLRNGFIPVEWETISQAAKRFRDTDVLTKEMAEVFIDRIDVYPDYISMKWRFQDIWEKMLAGRELQTVLDLGNGGIQDEEQ